MQGGGGGRGGEGNVVYNERARNVSAYTINTWVCVHTYLRSHLLRSHGLIERNENGLPNASGFNTCSDMCPDDRQQLRTGNSTRLLYIPTREVMSYIRLPSTPKL